MSIKISLCSSRISYYYSVYQYSWYGKKNTKKWIKTLFKNSVKVSLSGDLWNENGIVFFGVMGHGIGTDFEMRQILLGLICCTDNRYISANIKNGPLHV